MCKSIWDDYQGVILAGGFGTRVKHILKDIPKPMAEVNGTPFLYWIITRLLRQGLDNIVLSTHYQGPIIETFIHKNFNDKNIKCIQEPTPQGTGGGVIFVKKVLENQMSLFKNKFIVLNGDSLIAGDFSKATDMMEEDTDCVIIGVEATDTDRYGRLKIDKNNILMSFEEKKSGIGIINAGIYLIRSCIFDEYQSLKKPISFEYDIFPAMIKDKKIIKVFLMNCPFIDIGTEVSLAYANKFIRDNFNE